jgi:hypothetical protein
MFACVAAVLLASWPLEIASIRPSTELITCSVSPRMHTLFLPSSLFTSGFLSTRTFWSKSTYLRVLLLRTVKAGPIRAFGQSALHPSRRPDEYSFNRQE